MNLHASLDHETVLHRRDGANDCHKHNQPSAVEYEMFTHFQVSIVNQSSPFTIAHRAKSILAGFVLLNHHTLFADDRLR